jgi:hypothetical protein
MGDVINIKTGQKGTFIPNAILDDPWLSLGAKGLYAVAKRAEEAGTPLVSTGLSAEARGYLQELITGGHIGGPTQ